MRYRLVEPPQVVRVQFDLNSRHVLFQIAPLLRPRDRHDVVAPSQEPRQGNLARRDISTDSEVILIRSVLGETNRTLIGKPT